MPAKRRCRGTHGPPDPHRQISTGAQPLSAAVCGLFPAGLLAHGPDKLGIGEQGQTGLGILKARRQPPDGNAALSLGRQLLQGLVHLSRDAPLGKKVPEHQGPALVSRQHHNGKAPAQVVLHIVRRRLRLPP